MDTLIIRKPDDFHVHFRDSALLKRIAKHTATQCARALVMPNTIPPIDSARRLCAYYDRIKVATSAFEFEPLMTFKIHKLLKPEEVKALKLAGAIAGKFYPVGVTTNAEDGVSSLREIEPILATMEELDLVLCIHAEKPGVGSLEAEQAFLPDFERVCEKFPDLRVVFEHISTAEGITLVRSLPRTVAATISVHHLVLTFEDVVGRSFSPHIFCKPLPKAKHDREAILEAATSGSAKFFFGSDSAPHSKQKKESACCPAGIFSAPIALEYLAQIFEKAFALHKLQSFVSEYGALFYKLPLNASTLLLERRPMLVPKTIDGIVPLAAGSTLNWTIGGN